MQTVKPAVVASMQFSPSHVNLSFTIYCHCESVARQIDPGDGLTPHIEWILWETLSFIEKRHSLLE